MHTLSQDTIGSVAAAGPHKIHSSVEPADPETLGPRVLGLSGLLQTTLDVEQQMDLLAKNIRSYLDIDGLKYSNVEFGKTYCSGDTATHRATYDLKLEDAQLGSLCFCRETPFTGAELKLLENLLCGLVYPLRNALSYLEALQLASHDPLIGIQNRLAMQQALGREADLAKRQAAPLSMLIIDADHFKRFNDEFGHAFGDDVLRALANAAAATVRRSDLLFRYGGEEFVVLASHTNLQGAHLLAERIREAVESIVTIRGRDVRLSVSIGVAELKKEESADELFERADNAMYRAKEAGRNQVVVS